MKTINKFLFSLLIICSFPGYAKDEPVKMAKECQAIKHHLKGKIKEGYLISQVAQQLHKEKSVNVSFKNQSGDYVRRILTILDIDNDGSYELLDFDFRGPPRAKSQLLFITNIENQIVEKLIPRQSSDKYARRAFEKDLAKEFEWRPYKLAEEFEQLQIDTQPIEDYKQFNNIGREGRIKQFAFEFNKKTYLLSELTGTSQVWVSLFEKDNGFANKIVCELGNFKTW